MTIAPTSVYWCRGIIWKCEHIFCNPLLLPNLKKYAYIYTNNDKTMGTNTTESVPSMWGLAMVIMALDHIWVITTSMPIHKIRYLATTSPGLFMTRWITHFCAPPLCCCLVLRSFEKDRVGIFSVKRDFGWCLQKYLLFRWPDLLTRLWNHSVPGNITIGMRAWLLGIFVFLRCLPNGWWWWD